MNPIWVVEKVYANADYTLLLTYSNGEKRIYDASPLLKKAIFEPLRDLSNFLNARVECGTVVWTMILTLRQSICMNVVHQYNQ